VQQMRNAFWVGLIAFALGAGLLVVTFLLGQPAEGVGRTLHNVLALVALLLAASGGFLFICAGAVLLTGLFTAPRVERRKS
jgi:hypothetical protein